MKVEIGKEEEVLKIEWEQRYSFEMESKSETLVVFLLSSGTLSRSNCSSVGSSLSKDFDRSAKCSGRLKNALKPAQAWNKKEKSINDRALNKNRLLVDLGFFFLFTQKHRAD